MEKGLLSKWSSYFPFPWPSPWLPTPKSKFALLHGFRKVGKCFSGSMNLSKGESKRYAREPAYLCFFMKKKRGQNCGVASEAATCNIGIPYRHQFWSSYLLMYLKRPWKMAQVLGPVYPCERPGGGSSWLLAYIWPSPSRCCLLESEPANGRYVSLPFCSCDFQIN